MSNDRSRGRLPDLQAGQTGQGSAQPPPPTAGRHLWPLGFQSHRPLGFEPATRPKSSSRRMFWASPGAASLFQWVLPRPVGAPGYAPAPKVLRGLLSPSQSLPGPGRFHELSFLHLLRGRHTEASLTRDALRLRGRGGQALASLTRGNQEVSTCTPRGDQGRE